MSVHDAEPGDIYVDANGKLWRVVSTCSEPTVCVEEVEGYIPQDPMLLNAAAAQANAYRPRAPELIRSRQSGGVGGAMWEGFKRIFRPAPR